MMGLNVGGWERASADAKFEAAWKKKQHLSFDHDAWRRDKTKNKMHIWTHFLY